MIGEDRNAALDRSLCTNTSNNLFAVINARIIFQRVTDGLRLPLVRIARFAGLKTT